MFPDKTPTVVVAVRMPTPQHRTGARKKYEANTIQHYTIPQQTGLLLQVTEPSDNEGSNRVFALRLPNLTTHISPTPSNASYCTLVLPNGDRSSDRQVSLPKETACRAGVHSLRQVEAEPAPTPAHTWTRVIAIDDNPAAVRKHAHRGAKIRHGRGSTVTAAYFQRRFIVGSIHLVFEFIVGERNNDLQNRRCVGRFDLVDLRVRYVSGERGVRGA